ncbi:MAG: 3-methyladenine DNA glycosylase [Omnitrophica bacterium RIFCSPHIGHO2_02_FULL_46_11]|nr:MAG: 3-methyladenine DNA glycosylase [Omnitrophica bacterium RIFCSPLOWO2_01_FULL_45_10b]OGW86872.1 MAG: 3-methyladenine DNA glycosylase [Omnitrophica bacterium RIFCSPHIGHO2_02_FULL_46_11]
MSPVSLDRHFYERNTQVVAFELIGKVLVFKENGTKISGKIVETEAYFGAKDPASHAYRGMTPRNRVMFGAPGVSYVYFTYGNHHCLNVVTEKEGTAGAVLIRALEPMEGIELMKKRRGKANEEQLTNGPGKLTQAFGITREHSGINLTSGSFYIGETGDQEFLSIQTAKRIGISRAKDELLRFYLSTSDHVSVR